MSAWIDDQNDAARMVPAQPEVPVAPVEGLSTVCFCDVEPAQNDGLEEIPGLEGVILEGAITIVLDTDPCGQAITVKLDGCGRLVAASGETYAAPPEVIPALAQLVEP